MSEIRIKDYDSIVKEARLAELPASQTQGDRRTKMRETLQAMTVSVNAGNAVYALREADAFVKTASIPAILAEFKVTAKDVLPHIESELERISKRIDELIVKAEAGKARKGDAENYKASVAYEKKVQDEMKALRGYIKNKDKPTE